MPVNQKKCIRLKNRTKYFIADKDKTFVTFSSPYSYQSRSIKIEGYETRLYWQFRYCEENDGQTFFYTLTYNNANLPRHYGQNCFDYEDLRDLMTGGFRKMLLRKYGTKFKYFVGAELGDGKGERGMHNNPHYHILFFLENAENPCFPYVKISPVDFRHLVRKYWQGFDEDTDGRIDYQKCKFGIVKEGENVGKVTDFRAISYVSKYVCKDAKLKLGEKRVRQVVRFREYERSKWHEEYYKSFFDEVIKPGFNIPLNASSTQWQYTDAELMKKLTGYEIFPVSVFGEYDGHFEPEGVDYTEFCKVFIKEYDYRLQFNTHRRAIIAAKIDEAITEWRNRFCNKCRISQGVGDYALNFIDDKLNPKFEVPGKKGPKQRPLPMYYYRKLFTEVVHPVSKTFTGKIIKYPTIRVLNEDGINYKVYRLEKQINKKAYQAKNYFEMLVGNEELFNDMRKSDVNTQVFYHYDEFLRRYNYLLLDNENKDEIFRRYAEYKIIYEDRYFSIKSSRLHTGYNMPPICPAVDYRRFLSPSIYSCHRSDLRLNAFLESTDEDYLSYAEHPYFLYCIGLFGVLDLCADYFFVQEDNRKQKTAEEIATTKRFHTERNLREFYKQFGL